MRRVAQVVPSTVEPGHLVTFRSVFPAEGAGNLDPFLLLHHHGPTEVGPRPRFGFPNHPHYGFETVTYVLAGQLQHRDSRGGQGLLGPGDVQWMTAGAGLVHSELPGPEIVARGGTLELFQLWVNLPGEVKGTEPRYQDLRAGEIPVASGDDGRVTVRVVAGEALGARAGTFTYLPITFVHATLAPGGAWTQPVAPADTAAAYVFRGGARAGGAGPEARSVEAGSLVVFAPAAADGEPAIRLENPGPAPCELLLMTGRPIGEPVVWRGPFVATSIEELRRVLAEYQSGRFAR